MTERGPAVDRLLMVRDECIALTTFPCLDSPWVIIVKRRREDTETSTRGERTTTLKGICTVACGHDESDSFEGNVDMTELNEGSCRCKSNRFFSMRRRWGCGRYGGMKGVGREDESLVDHPSTMRGDFSDEQCFSASLMFIEYLVRYTGPGYDNGFWSMIMVAILCLLSR